MRENTLITRIKNKRWNTTTYLPGILNFLKEYYKQKKKKGKKQGVGG